MGKNQYTNNKNKVTIENNTTKKESSSPVTEKFLAFLKRNQVIRKEKKIWFWLILVPPIGLYKSIKYKAFSKSVNVFIAILLLLTLALGLDSFIYPNRVIDYKITQSIEEYNKLGDIREFNKIGTLDEKLFIYNVLTTKGMYDVYFSGDGKMTIEGIYEIHPSKEMIYKTSKMPKELDDVYAEIIRFFNDKEIVEKYGNIIEAENGLKENHQIIVTDKGKYSIEVNYNQVVAVYSLDDNNNYTKLMQKNPEITLPTDIAKVLKNKTEIIGEVNEVYAYELNDKTQEYLFTNKDNVHYKITKYLDGSMELFIQDESTDNNE